MLCVPTAVPVVGTSMKGPAGGPASASLTECPPPTPSRVTQVLVGQGSAPFYEKVTSTIWLGLVLSARLSVHKHLDASPRLCFGQEPRARGEPVTVWVPHGVPPTMHSEPSRGESLFSGPGDLRDSGRQAGAPVPLQGQWWLLEASSLRVRGHTSVISHRFGSISLPGGFWAPQSASEGLCCTPALWPQVLPGRIPMGSSCSISGS